MAQNNMIAHSNDLLLLSEVELWDPKPFSYNKTVGKDALKVFYFACVHGGEGNILIYIKLTGLKY